MDTIVHYLQLLVPLPIAAALGAALGTLRPARRGLVPRPVHIVHAEILLTIVGAMIMVIVAESLARAFAIVGAAGLIRYRARVEDPKDAGVMLVALAAGLAVGARLYFFGTAATLFVIGVLWLLESVEPAALTRFDLKIGASDADKLRPDIERALDQKGVTFELRGASPSELHYEVMVPYQEKIGKLTKLIKGLDGHSHPHPSVEWEIKKYKTVRP